MVGSFGVSSPPLPVVDPVVSAGDGAVSSAEGEGEGEGDCFAAAAAELFSTWQDTYWY